MRTGWKVPQRPKGKVLLPDGFALSGGYIYLNRAETLIAQCLFDDRSFCSFYVAV